MGIQKVLYREFKKSSNTASEGLESGISKVHEIIFERTFTTYLESHLKNLRKSSKRFSEKPSLGI